MFKLLVGLAAVAYCAALVEEGSPLSPSPLLGYHESVGIPLAAEIKASEEAYLAQLAENANDEDSTDSALMPKIVGGVAAPTNSHPYLAGLVISFMNVAGNSVCGSSILSSQRLVTAAHCWWDGVNQARQYEVVLGSQWLFFGGTRVFTSQVIMHPQWSVSTLANDVAVIYLPTNIAFNTLIQPVSLPSGTQLSQDFAGLWATAAGYGKTSDAQTGVSTSAQIYQVTLQVIPSLQCQQIFNPWALPSNICTSGVGGVGICGGDSGGPLVVNQNGQNILVGISSFVASVGCQAGFPSVFARITSFYSFIIQNM